MSGEIRESFLRKAESLAVLIFGKLRELQNKPINELGPGSILSLLDLYVKLEKGESGDKEISSIMPRIYEIILYGSVAAGNEEPSDIDLMILDNGHFSNFFICSSDEHQIEGDWYRGLRENLLWLMREWFLVQEDQIQKILGETEVDLHVLPIQLLKSKEFREEAAKKHKDPNFFRNVFQRAMRFNRRDGHFEQLTLEYLEKQYHCHLDDLK